MAYIHTLKKNNDSLNASFLLKVTYMCKMNKSYENDVNPIHDRKRKQ